MIEYEILRQEINKLDIGSARKARMRGVLLRFQRQGAPCPKLEELLRYGRNGLAHLKPSDLR